MPYRVLVVDDEPGISEGMKYLVEHLAPDCQVVGIAFDGVQGVEKALALKPDIVLTDIRMPDMDGLAMIRSLRELDFSTRFIILSGYADFEYARTAISLGVEEYITKPVEEHELRVALQNACKFVKEDRRRQAQESEMEQAMIEYTLKDVLLGNTTASPEESRAKLQSFGFPMAAQGYTCAMVEVDDGNDAFDCNVFFAGLEQAADKYLAFCDKRVVFPQSEKSAVIIMAYDADYGSVSEGITNVRSAIASSVASSVSVGVGRMHRSVEKIVESFEEANCALNYKIIKGADCVVLYDQIRDIESRPILVAAEDITRFEKSIDTMDDEGCKLVIEEIFAKIEQEQGLTPTDIQVLSLNLILSALRKMSFMQIQLSEYLGKNIFSLESIEKFNTTTQLKNWTFNMIKSMNELMLHNASDEKRDVIDDAKDYINRNYHKNISLNEISERFFINPYYFSQLFKKKTGENYQDYLIALRVSRAKKLIEETELKIYEVCELVGYKDVKHFNKIFSRIIGMTPSEYKRKMEKE